MVELGRGVLLVGPGPAGVERDIGAAVVGLDHPLVVVGGDPEVVAVAVRDADVLEGATPVTGPLELHVAGVDGVLVLRVGVDPAVVPGPLPERAAVVHPGPGIAGIVGAVDPARIGLDLGIDPARIGGRDRNPDVADHAGRHAGIAGQLLPGPA